MRGRLVASGRNLDELSLRDWLDAGYVMMVEGCDATARTLFDDLFEAATREDMDAAFAELRSEVEYRRAASEEYERKQREQSGAPRHAKRVAPGVLEAAVDEWEQLRTGTREPDEDGV